MSRIFALLLPACLLVIEPVTAQTEGERLARNPFQRPAKTAAEKQPPRARANRTASASSGAPALRVTAVLVARKEPMALVNGKLLRIGESLRGARLVSVEEQAAWFEFRGRRLKYSVRSADSTKPRPKL